ncbi:MULTISPECIES: translation initiation factor IF-2 [unclassified Paenibacillus]|uniref:translation initiation factor IF-2 n=1 Tax=unclassified Paenibacillus TaxID=185978 RepID=UPI0027863C2D|nr:MULTISPECIES: translation initiation factor IF-2 [unclassified Paenibacillus]MDQ0899770.1 translation initiation factor IF-2 [Paenibacillus sp. V4I7]MDQ0914275.1 translation initiation factor IF-2 [Paenibacillus sp. V4I5]
MTNKQDNKDKTRVYEYAKQLNMSSKEIITILKRLNIPVNNHMSVMENDAVSSVEKFFRDIKANAAAKRAATDGGNVSSSTTNQNPATQAPAQENKGAATPASKPVASEPTNSTTTNGAVTAPQGQSTPNTASRPSQPGRDQRPSGQGSSQGGQRPNSQGQGGQRTGYQGSNPGGQRPSGQGSSQGGQRTGYQGSNPGGQRPSGQGSSQGGQRTGYQGSNPGGQRPSGSTGGYNSQRPSGGQGYSQGQGQSGAPRTNSNYAGSRPSQGTGGPGAGGGQSANSGRPQNAGPNRSAGPNRQSKPFDNRNNNQSGRPVIQEAKPQFHVGATAAELDDAAAKAGVITTKKSKPTPKRFDDNRSGGNRGPGGQNRGNQRGNNRGRYQQETVKKEKIDNTPKKIIVRGSMTVGETAKLLHKDASEVIKKLLFLGTMATINQELDLEAIQLIASEFGVEVEIKIKVEEDNFETFEEIDDEADLIERPPVVTIMGHVDHGKTTLLDAIRKTSVTEGEAGGITQHIGAYQVEVNQKKITFLDTPGHEAFTTMRARGAQVTDITIIVVAADDGVMPQTVEAINHAKAAGVPIIVAVNKIDKEGANPDQIKQALTAYELVPEEWGGDTIFCEISAKQRIGLENLLEMILLVAEVQEYKANPNKRARATVIEAELDKGRGPVARILIQHGTLKVGDSFVAGVCFGRVRAMVNDKGKRLKEAGPSTPVEITGLTEVPQAGDPFLAYEDERKARDIADRRSIALRQSEMTANSRVTLDDLFKHIKDGEIKELNVIIKGDVQGSVEALKSSLEKIEVEGVRVKILHNGVGAVTESDIILASASNAIIIGFNVRPEPAAKATADQEKVDIRLHNIIYNVIEEIEQAMKGMLDPIFKEVVLGQAEVRNVFKITGSGTIAGCMIISGKIARNAQTRLIRSGIVVHEGKIDSLKRFKDDQKEVAQGYECGISLERYHDIKEGDIIEAFIMESVER